MTSVLTLDIPNSQIVAHRLAPDVHPLLDADALLLQDVSGGQGFPPVPKVETLFLLLINKI